MFSGVMTVSVVEEKNGFVLLPDGYFYHLDDLWVEYWPETDDYTVMVNPKKVQISCYSQPNYSSRIE